MAEGDKRGDRKLKVLALEPYYGGSHRAFLDGWRHRSRHAWTLLTLPAHSWKWRMRASAVTFAHRLADADPVETRWDVLLCSDMLNLVELKGLCPRVQGLPAVSYFHENQLCYPVRQPDPRDVHFGLTNMITGLASKEVWFNSAWHREAFLSHLGELLRRMPARSPGGVCRRIAARSRVHSPGIDLPPRRRRRRAGPLRVLWSARWEHDKDPETFFDAVDQLARRRVEFRLSVIGQAFREAPEVFARARRRLAGHIDRWGYQPTRRAYQAALREADVFVSTARHEFFGIAAAEAVAAGAWPLLPRDLAYPELLELDNRPELDGHFHDGSTGEVAGRLTSLAETLSAGGDIWDGDPHRARRAVERFTWERVAGQLDAGLVRAAGR